MKKQTMDRIGATAREYRKLAARGDFTLAEQARRTLNDLGAGSYVDGRWVLDAWVLREMGEVVL